MSLKRLPAPLTRKLLDAVVITGSSGAGGKRNEELILPLNDSISFTLSQNEMHAKTTVMISPKFMKDKIWLNQIEEKINSRVSNCLKQVRKEALENENQNVDPNWHIHIVSENNFPTAAGLASSAAGYACLVSALGNLFGLNSDLSRIARLGSGSACRSLEGGIVRWFSGTQEDGSDSIARQIAPSTHFADLHVVICVASDDRKKTSSTEGMRRCAQTSKLMTHRIGNSVKDRIVKIMISIEKKDWPSFCRCTIEDSNEMHGACLSSYPPCIYMNDSSHAVAKLVYSFNDFKLKEGKDCEMVCYTFDAGPNACLFVPSESLTQICFLLNQCFESHDSSQQYWRGIPVDLNATDSNSEIFQPITDECKKSNHSIKYFIHTKIGDGPAVLGEDSHLIDTSSGLPRNYKA